MIETVRPSSSFMRLLHLLLNFHSNLLGTCASCLK